MGRLAFWGVQEDRTIKKIVLLTAINAPSDIKAIQGIRRKLIDDGIREDVLKDESLKSLLNLKTCSKKVMKLIGSKDNVKSSKELAEHDLSIFSIGTAPE